MIRKDWDWHFFEDFCLLCSLFFARALKEPYSLMQFFRYCFFSSSSTAMVEALRLTVAALNSSLLFFATSHMNSWTPPQKKTKLQATTVAKAHWEAFALAAAAAVTAFDSMTTSIAKNACAHFFTYATPTLLLALLSPILWSSRKSSHFVAVGKNGFPISHFTIIFSIYKTLWSEIFIFWKWKRFDYFSLKLLIKILISNVKAVIRPFERPMKKLNIKSKKDWFFRGQKFFSDPALLYLLTLRWYMSIARWFYLQNRHLKTTHFSPIFQIF